jgi:hypothetical protein
MAEGAFTREATQNHGAGHRAPVSVAVVRSGVHADEAFSGGQSGDHGHFSLTIVSAMFSSVFHRVADPRAVRHDAQTREEGRRGKRGFLARSIGLEYGRDKYLGGVT